MAYVSVIKLLQNVNLYPDYNDTLYFNSVSEQTQFFLSKAVYTFTDVMYVKENTVKIPGIQGTYMTCKYMMYQNPDFNNKWFYAFINKVSYLNDGTTIINYSDDLLQTWFFEMILQECLVTREHVLDDTIGKHLKEEGLALGDYIVNNSTIMKFSDWWIVICSAIKMEGTGEEPAEGQLFENRYSALEIRAYSPTDLDTIQDVLNAFAGNGKSEALINMYMCPKIILGASITSGSIVDPQRVNHYMYINQSPNLNGYSPKNNKLYTYPYRGIKLSNNCGNNVILRYEYFQGPGAKTMIYQGSVSSAGRIILYPMNYKGKEENFDYAITLGDYPQCAWLQDVYANWLATQNVRWGYESERRYTDATNNWKQSAGSALLGALTGNIGNAAEGAMSLWSNNNAYEDMEEKAQSLMSEEKEIHSMIPPSATGTIGNASTMAAIDEYGFVADYISITKEYAKSIDEYLSMFGYRVDEVKIPNLIGRESWNYVKTVNACVVGNAPIQAITTFKNTLNRGIRFWHGDYIGDYSRSNNIVEVS